MFKIVQSERSNTEKQFVKLLTVKIVAINNLSNLQDTKRTLNDCFFWIAKGRKYGKVFESYFKWLYESPEENSDSVTLTQQLDESSSSEESQEADIDEIFLNKKTNLFDKLIIVFDTPYVDEIFLNTTKKNIKPEGLKSF